MTVGAPAWAGEELSSASNSRSTRTFDVPEPSSPPHALLVMAVSAGRSRIDDALASVGWSVTALDDGWALLDHLADAGGARVQSPTLAVVEVAVAGPRLGALVRRLRALYLDLPVLLVGTERARATGVFLRPPFLARRVLAAVHRVVRGR